MSFRQSLQRIRRSRKPGRRPRPAHSTPYHPHLETLEQRAVPTILFPKTDTRVPTDSHGPVINHADVELVFWGTGWNSGVGPSLRTNLTAAAQSIVSGPFLTLLSQYRSTIGPGQVVGAVTITSSSPPASFNDGQVQSMLQTNLSNGTLPNPNTDSQLLYMVITQPGSSDGNIGGEHNSAVSQGTRFHYGWTINNRSQSTITSIFSHELAEAVTDAEPNFAPAITIPSTRDEIGDGNAQNFSFNLNGYVVQSLLDARDNAYSVENGTVQQFPISSSHVLTINGDQLGDQDDTITLDLSGSITRVTINGETALFPTGGWAVNSIVINPGHGTNTINIDQTVSGRPVTINLGDGTNTVNLAEASGNLNNLVAPVTINSNGGSDSVNVFDQNNATVRAYRLTDTTLSRPGTSGQVLINYSGGISNLTVYGGSAANDTYTVAGSGAASTSIVGGPNGGTLIGPDDATTWEVTGANAGILSAASLAGPVSFAGLTSLKGGGGDNTFVLDDGQGIDGAITGGGGVNALDYSAYSSTVLVNLQTGEATGVGGGVANIQNALGGNGGGSGVYNILVGNGGNLLVGGVGRTNLLIAGASASTLIGGDQDDILIGGTTAYDTEADMASLRAIMDYWSTSADDYATRVASLLSGTGVPLLDASTVTNNGGGNTLTGNGGGAGELNLFYGLDPSQETTDFNPLAGEQFINI